jgi:hypothetical protein
MNNQLSKRFIKKLSPVEISKLTRQELLMLNKLIERRAKGFNKDYCYIYQRRQKKELTRKSVALSRLTDQGYCVLTDVPKYNIVGFSLAPRYVHLQKIKPI